MNRPAHARLVGIIGAGTMGAGIAQVAAAAGHTVLLLDVRPGAAAAANAQIAAALSRLVDKGKLGALADNGLLARIVAAEALHELSEASLVIEVIVEDLAAKQGLLRELENHVAADAVLASNTSTISVTAIAQGMRNPERVVGMHFFNPVPQMKVVEVVSGAETAPAVAANIFALSQSWGKTPVHARSTPRFIVNRIARPFYAETLQLLLEQAATPADLDECARGAGFRMGPCELMDLIGHDINYAVTLSVFNATYGDRRFQPSPVQKALVAGGRLGRKSGKGFFEGGAVVSADVEPLTSASLEVHGTSALAARFARLLEQRGIAFERIVGSDWHGLLADGVRLHITDARSAAQVATQSGFVETAVIDWPLGTAPGALRHFNDVAGNARHPLRDGAKFGDRLRTGRHGFGLHDQRQRCRRLPRHAGPRKNGFHAHSSPMSSMSLKLFCHHSGFGCRVGI